MNQQLPNIFKYATRELSQDAFLCWLLSLADKKYATTETQSLHELAVNLIHKFYNDSKFEFTDVKVKKQKQRIDIWVEIDEKYLLVIEDKTNSNAGIDQLITYKKTAADFCKKNNFESPKCVYLKTGLESANQFSSNAKNEGWTMFSLEDLFLVFNSQIKNISHPFVVDFFNITKEKINRRENYSCFIKSTESANDVISVFYKHLEQDGIFKRWGAVDIRGTRRLFADNCYFIEDEYAVYMQLEKLKLRIKINLGQLGSEKGKQYKTFKKGFDQKDIRSIYDKIGSLLKTNTFFEDIATKPAKFSKHNYLTFAEIENSAWLVFTKNDTLDYDKTAENIKNIKQQLIEFITSSKDSIKIIVEDVFKK
ncbi:MULTISPECIES: PD-(D/E)XK nuclease family protein [Chryseobacterium]|uniref:PD-(D/E)XK nuclease family protein n=1 Tax=Chryseobacterium TaxID=59732 RepID=UPI00195EB41B|nr:MULTISPECIES: PD-(D/E)XK nuclease family protein [Chryseobacterium]MBM7421054.1 hypothetical protein [Chryseobacterium sp. JUb44]MDH6211012.1 hypothetical protein [Chryseobacterium sp. BIGb0186]WSO09677.1 PD-(D/E)XK nuclease family protein [Chryseobacterium scophthalmum]